MEIYLIGITEKNSETDTRVNTRDGESERVSGSLKMRSEKNTLRVIREGVRN